MYHFYVKYWRLLSRHGYTAACWWWLPWKPDWPDRGAISWYWQSLQHSTSEHERQPPSLYSTSYILYITTLSVLHQNLFLIEKKNVSNVCKAILEVVRFQPLWPKIYVNQQNRLQNSFFWNSLNDVNLFAPEHGLKVRVFEEGVVRCWVGEWGRAACSNVHCKTRLCIGS